MDCELLLLPEFLDALQECPARHELWREVVSSRVMQAVDIKFRQPGNRNRRWTSLHRKLWNATLTKLLKSDLNMKDCVGRLPSV